jgi:2-dehydropantoate 2-reductase
MIPVPAAPRILIVGAGAVGCSAGAWLTQAGHAVTYLTRGPHGAALAHSGLTVHTREDPSDIMQVPAKVAEIGDAPEADIIVLAVKTYSLEQAASTLRDRYGDAPLVVGLQNGIANQQILPRYFSRVVYGVVGYNAWMDAPGVIGCQRRGPLVFGVLDPALAEAAQHLAARFNTALPTSYTDRLEDAAHCKLVINLANSLTTLIDFPAQAPDDFAVFQKLLSRMTYEGIGIVQAAGYRECRVAGLPPWALIRAGALLPGWLTRRAFRANVRKMVRNSLAQDVAHDQRDTTELDDINGYLIQLADQHGIAAPINRAIYALCQARLAQPPFTPMQATEVWQHAQFRNPNGAA